MPIKIKKVKMEEMKKKGVLEWPTWEKEISRFDWHYDRVEECYLLEGHVVVEASNGERFEFGEGDFVTFPKDLSCVWDIQVPVKKHFNYK